MIAKVIAAIMVALNIGLSTVFMRSVDWRDKTLGWIVIIVYIYVILYTIRGKTRRRCS